MIQSESGQDTFKTKKSPIIPYHRVFRSYVGSLVRGRPNEWVLRPEKPPGHSHLRRDPRRPIVAPRRSRGLSWVTPTTYSTRSGASTPEQERQNSKSAGGWAPLRQR